MNSSWDEAGQVLEGLLARYVEELDDAGLQDEYLAVCADLGSRWRIDWPAIGAYFLTRHRRWQR